MRRLGWSCLFLLIVGCRPEAARRTLVVAYLPNLTHAPAFLLQVRRDLEKALPGVAVRWKAFPSGPEIVEAFFAGELDLGFLGLVPALNGIHRSGGKAMCLLSGAVRGGSALVVAADKKEAGNFPEGVIASPAYANTQDVTLRRWLRERNLSVGWAKGEIPVLPVSGSDQLLLFQRGDLKAAWAVEPWVSRLEEEGGGRIFADDAAAWGTPIPTTVAVAGGNLLKDEEQLRKVRSAVIGAVQDLSRRDDDVKNMIRSILAKHLRQHLRDTVFERAWARLIFDEHLTLEEIERVLQEMRRQHLLQAKRNGEGHFWCLESLTE